MIAPRAEVGRSRGAGRGHGHREPGGLGEGFDERGGQLRLHRDAARDRKARERWVRGRVGSLAPPLAPSAGRRDKLLRRWQLPPAPQQILRRSVAHYSASSAWESVVSRRSTRSDVPSDRRPGASQRRLTGEVPSPGELRWWALVSVGVARFPSWTSPVRVRSPALWKCFPPQDFGVGGVFRVVRPPLVVTTARGNRSPADISVSAGVV